MDSRMRVTSLNTQPLPNSLALCQKIGPLACNQCNQKPTLAVSPLRDQEELSWLGGSLAALRLVLFLIFLSDHRFHQAMLSRVMNDANYSKGGVRRPMTELENGLKIGRV